jgi:cobalt-zinc-cadmium efflux system membrane fusion protein
LFALRGIRGSTPWAGVAQEELTMLNRFISVWREGPWHAGKRVVLTAAAVVVAGIVIGFYHAARADGASGPNAGSSAGRAAEPAAADAVQLSDTQLQMINIDTVSQREFPLQREAVGTIDFNEEMSVQVFTPYPGRILKLYAKVGDSVKKGETLFTIQSPDLIQAESTLIAAAGVRDLTTHVLERAKELYEVQGIAQKDLQQAVSDQQTAEGSLKAARNAVSVFGKTQSEIDHIVATRTIDPSLVVPSPITGRITSRNAAPGLYAQPGNAPAPYSVADVSLVWMVASVAEVDMPLVRKGQQMDVSVMAFPGRVFKGQISTLGATVDPQLHRGMIRAEIQDPAHELLPGMFATFQIVTGEPVRASAVPLDGVVREGDGSMTVWVTEDRHHFKKRTVRIGLQRNGYDEIVEGVHPGELVVTKGAIFLDNLASGGLS